jgi:FkbM family methyltransferase
VNPGTDARPATPLWRRIGGTLYALHRPPRTLPIPLGPMLRRHRARVTGVIHVGGHKGEEAASYAASGIDTVFWVEANPELIPGLRENVAPLGGVVLQGAVSDRDGDAVKFHVTDNFQSSSILLLGTHREHYPHIQVTHDVELRTTTLDTLLAEQPIERVNYLDLDIQGAELLALRGARRLMGQIDYVYTEVNREEVYVGAPMVEEIDDFLSEFRMRRVETRWTPDGWGDAFYVRDPLPAWRNPRTLLPMRV